ncbi:MAG: Ig-like domain-containing protein, partial [Verrucomicrobiota bacterium]
MPADLNPTIDPLLGAISRRQDGRLDPTLRDGSPAYGIPQTETPGFVTVAFTGAFGSENWAQDWTALGAEGFFKATAIKPAGPSLSDIIPVAKAQSISAIEDTALAVTLVGTDPQMQALTYTVVSGPSLGTLSGTAPNLTYTPRANANGTDSFTFKVNDGVLDSEPATVSITVQPVPDAPIAQAQDVAVRENTAATITLQAVDPDGDALKYTVVSQPTLGSLTGTAPNLTYTPKLNSQGNDSFTFKVGDGSLESAVVTVRITIGNLAGNVINVPAGYLYGTQNWVATNTYILTGFTYVMSNAVLNIEAGTVVKGASGTGTSSSAANDFGCLFVCAGGKLNANGTPTRPIIFTAVADDVTDPGDLPFPSRGLWGGIVLFGNARLNNPAWTTNSVSHEIYEGLPDISVTNAVTGQIDYIHRFGGTNDDDSSGSMRYVSVRHGGKKLTTDKEINGWSLGAVGRGTLMEYLEAYCTADDGFEFFGGSVNTKHLVSAFNDDDGFDTDEGYNGQNQFWFGIQEPTAKDNGSEQNGQPQPPDVRVPGALPLGNYTIRNATLIGAGTNTTANDALRFRQENKGRWYNSLFTEFGGVRVRIDDDGVSTPDVKNNLFWGFNAGTTEDYGGPYVPADVNPVANPKLRSISRKQDGGLDPRPSAGSPAFEGTMATPADGFWTPVNYKGAFDADDNWAYGWTALSAEGFFPARDNVIYVDSTYLYDTYNWSATNIYILTGFTYVMSNAVLNIEPGTVIKGVSGTGTTTSAANDFGCLFVCRGGKINANGTPNNPIIMTAEVDDVDDPLDLPFPSRGLWGGIVVFGNARLNNPAWTTNNVNYEIYEGLPDLAVTNALTGQIDYLHRFGGNDD